MATQTASALAARLFAQMVLIRRAEEALLDLFGRGELAGTTHTSIGQEAIAVAVGAHLREGDAVFSSHRGHGHFLAAGGPLVELMAELMGRDSALCGGRGGSQHLHYRGFHSSGVQGGVVGNAVGAALAQKLEDSDAVTVVFLGDGTLGEGLVYESLNFAALKHLPVLFVLEDNRYAQSTPVERAVAGSMVGRAGTFGIAAHEVESNDALELHELFRDRVERVRAEREPFFQVVHTYRLAPHSKGDDDRDPAEVERWRARDPLLIARRQLPGDEADRLEVEARARVDTAVAEARARPDPTPAPTPPDLPTEPFPPPWPAASTTYVRALNGALDRLLAEDPRAFVLGQDVLDPYGGAFKVTRGLSTRLQDRVIAAPISEAGIVAWGTGAALRGMRPVVEIMFGDFLTLAADQIVNHASKYRFVYGGETTMGLVIRTPMGGRRGYGPTHSQSLESMFTGTPGLVVVAPSHLLDPGELLIRASRHLDDPVLFVEHKLLYPRRVEPPADGRIGPFFVRASEGCFPTLHLSLAEFAPAEAAIVCYGGATPLALEAAERLLVEHEVLCAVVVPSLLSPLPLDELRDAIGGCPRVVVVEEGPRTGGWGAEVVAALADGAPRRSYRRVAAADSPIPASRVLEDAVLPSMDDLLAAVLAG